MTFSQFENPSFFKFDVPVELKERFRRACNEAAERRGRKIKMAEVLRQLVEEFCVAVESGTEEFPA